MGPFRGSVPVFGSSGRLRTSQNVPRPTLALGRVKRGKITGFVQCSGLALSYPSLYVRRVLLVTVPILTSCPFLTSIRKLGSVIPPVPDNCSSFSMGPSVPDRQGWSWGLWVESGFLPSLGAKDPVLSSPREREHWGLVYRLMSDPPSRSSLYSLECSEHVKSKTIGEEKETEYKGKEALQGSFTFKKEWKLKKKLKRNGKKIQR